MKEENKKTKILDKIPPGVLVPLALLGALVLAGLLIWLGIKLSPVELRDPEAISAEKQQEEWRKKKLEKDNNNENEAGTSLPDYEYNFSKANTNEAVGDQNIQSDGSSPAEAGDGSVSGGDTSATGSNNNSNLSSDIVSKNNNSSDSKGEDDSGKANTNSNLITTARGCTYPAGDVNVWWHRASLKQRECYIAEHGQPVFDQDDPYFCDYEKSEDCFYKEYK